MGGGGFMQHASDTNRKDRAQRAARRQKFNGNFSEDTVLTGKDSEKIEFPKLPEEEVEKERQKIRIRFKKRRFNYFLICSIGLVLVAIGTIALYIRTKGFEYW